MRVAANGPVDRTWTAIDVHPGGSDDVVRGFRPVQLRPQSQSSAAAGDVLPSVARLEWIRRRFYIQRIGAELPAPGRYPLGGVDGYGARYEQFENRIREGYIAVSGDLEITVATPERIEGTFRMTAVRACTGSEMAMACVFPASPESPRIEAAGSFIAMEGSGP